MPQARQSTTPVEYQKSVRTDQSVLMSSGKAGKVLPIGYIPLLRGDSAAGRVSVDINLAEMPRPLLNSVMANVQAWFIPKSSHPKFGGTDEFEMSYHGDDQKLFPTGTRTPPAFFDSLSPNAAATADFYKVLGVHHVSGKNVNGDLIDAFVQAYNFRLRAHSNRLTLKPYMAQDWWGAAALSRAFWPSGRFSKVVPDYERALIVGSLDLDITAGQIPVSGMARLTGTAITPLTNQAVHQLDPAGSTQGVGTTYDFAVAGNTASLRTRTGSSGTPILYAEMASQTIGTSLADIDKARTTQAMAKLRAAYAGNDVSGFINDDTIIAALMQGFAVPEDLFKRPWLLDSKRVPFGFSERFATDAANLDDSVTTGQTTVTLSLNVPQQNVGGLIIFTLEVLPERIDERQSDEWLHVTNPTQLPNALRDIQRPEPVDMVLNQRLDAKHTTPDGLYGYEPMNDVWNRSTTRLGGAFYQPNPGAPVNSQRMGIWMTQAVNPVFSADHYLCPQNFPHYVFADTQADAFEFVVRHTVKIVGLTQIGDVLAENNDDYDKMAEG